MALLSSCREQRQPNGVIVALRNSKGMTFDGRGYLFVVSDKDVLSFDDTMRLAKAMADNFGYTTIAIVDSQTYHLLNYEWPHELVVIGSNYPRILDQGAVLLFPNGSPPKPSSKQIAVILNGKKERDNAEWQVWCRSNDVPYAVAKGTKDHDIIAAIKIVQSALIEKEHGRDGKKN